MLSDKPDNPPTTLPKGAYLPINRCNLPPQILGSLTFQNHPTPITIDGVLEHHADLFRRLQELQDSDARAQQFMDYLDVRFCLKELEEMGWEKGKKRHRHKADYIRMVRGWSFDADAREGAVLKGWVESRFGLLPRHHAGPIPSPDSEAYRKFQETRSQGIYNTNALEGQLDLLYTYGQYELRKLYPKQTHLTLYRGVNRIDEHEILESQDRRNHTVVLNSLNSFSDNPERADEFGDYIMATEVPLAKIFFFNRLLPKMLRGEDEFVVIGGVYRVKIETL